MLMNEYDVCSFDAYRAATAILLDKTILEDVRSTEGRPEQLWSRKNGIDKAYRYVD